MKIAVGIATTGRPAILTKIVASLGNQTRLADRIVICPAKQGDADVPALQSLGLPIDILSGPPGASHQRNTIIEHLRDFDLVLFLDDDFLLHPTYIACTEAIMSNHPDIVLMTGNVLADGARSMGIPLEVAQAILDGAAVPAVDGITETFSGYGCNMTARLRTLFESGLRFDEDFPLYAWLEDMELSRSLARVGRVVRAERPLGVHLAIKSGRTSGVRFGYSQIANPVHIFRKGLIPLSVVVSHAGKNLVSNAVRSLYPEPHIDRVGRLKGNLKALFHLASGRLDPRAILDL